MTTRRQSIDEVHTVNSVSGELVDTVEQVYQLDVSHDCPVHIAAALLIPDARGIKRVVSGRGYDAESAFSRCMSEAIERQSAVYRDAHRIIRASSADLVTTAIAPRSLLQISDAQYVHRETWNAQVDGVHHLPQRFDQSKNIGWVNAQSLTSQSSRFVPAAWCFLGYPDALEEGFPIPDSSGLAAGDSISDAIARGLFELIERDAVSIWWYNRLVMPPLIFDNQALEIWQPFSDWIARCGRRFWLLDLTLDLNVPVVAAISCNQQGSDLSVGFGSALRPEMAAEHAMCELVQFEVTKMYYRPPTSNAYPHFLQWCQSAKVNDNSFLLPDDTHRKTRADETCSAGAVLDLLASKDLEAFAFHLSKPNQSKKVVRVIVPGLRSIWPRYGAGRLYDVPFAQGLFERPRSESDLNPIPMLY